MNELYFKEKKQVVFFVPKQLKPNCYEAFLVEMLETVEAYVMPIANGVSKGDIAEYIYEPRYKKVNLIEYLRFKKYIADRDDFTTLFTKYCLDEAEIVQGVEVTISNIVEMDIELEAKVASAIQLILTNDIGLERLNNVIFKPVQFDSVTRKFSHLRKAR